MAAVAVSVELPERDRQVVELVAKFRQMTRQQLRACLFSNNASATPLDRALKRLVEEKHLTRLARLVGGDKGGSAQYVYQLGRAGWKLLDKPGAYWAPRAVNLHTLAIADCYAWLKQAEHRGELEVIQFTNEPECHQAAGRVLLTPDAYVEIGSRDECKKRCFWLEVDRGTEHLRKIQGKCDRYWWAYSCWQEDYFPTVLFVVPDEQRKRGVERVLRDGSSCARRIFSVHLFGNLVSKELANIIVERS
ncbi:replication-relaxation family protein [Amycolatopsis sp. H20-H5]|uniref:replication-relaxation family protein n=1 Tax=Amycolatopsis sp. H20-H5 TaxID=3046309 RepID=UPI002DB6F4F0|nr:replication-relaxation family protein [Amycolatopsis sp. H20-H5]MEC3978143.1 replication-relaxation family protein [Amycolatopsis sp. H20-H5]